MDTTTQPDLITTEEYRREWRRLRDLRLPFDSPEVTSLMERLRKRDDTLFERYGRELVDSYPDKWIAISTEGDTIVRDFAWEARREGDARFGPGAFAVRKLNHEFQGIRIRH